MQAFCVQNKCNYGVVSEGGVCERVREMGKKMKCFTYAKLLHQCTGPFAHSGFNCIAESGVINGDASTPKKKRNFINIFNVYTYQMMLLKKFSKSFKRS